MQNIPVSGNELVVEDQHIESQVAAARAFHIALKRFCEKNKLKL
jgi:hypothetical protein